MSEGRRRSKLLGRKRLLVAMGTVALSASTTACGAVLPGVAGTRICTTCPDASEGQDAATQDSARADANASHEDAASSDVEGFDGPFGVIAHLDGSTNDSL
jgi:hypothetical protein